MGTDSNIEVMKNIKLFFLPVVVLLMFSRCGNDDEFYNSKYLMIPNLIEIEHQEIYTVGDIFWLNTHFSKLLQEENQTTLLDIYKTTGGASFGFVYGIEKKNADNTWTMLNVGESAIIDNGNLEGNYYNVAESIYDPVSETYKFRAGFPLTETGEYRTFFGYSPVSYLELSSNNDNEKETFVAIKTTANNMTDGFYYFSVQ